MSASSTQPVPRTVEQPTLVALPGCQGRHGGVQSGEGIRDRIAAARRGKRSVDGTSIVLRGRVEEARRRCGVVSERDPTRFGFVSTVAGDAHPGHVRSVSDPLFCDDSKLGERARPCTLNHDVDPFEELFETGATSDAIEVERDALLARIQEIIEPRRSSPCAIGSSKAFKFDHSGARE